MRRIIILIFAPGAIISRHRIASRGIIMAARQIPSARIRRLLLRRNIKSATKVSATDVRITAANEIPRLVTKIPLQFLLRYILLNMQCEIKFIVQISRLQIRIKIHAELDSIIWRAAYVIFSHNEFQYFVN